LTLFGGLAKQAEAQTTYTVAITWPSSTDSVQNGVINTVTGTIAAIPAGGTLPTQAAVVLKDANGHTAGARGGVTKQTDGSYTFTIAVSVTGFTPCLPGAGQCTVTVTGGNDGSKGTATTNPGVTNRRRRRVPGKAPGSLSLHEDYEI
jgi:hypothetical protein